MFRQDRKRAGSDGAQETLHKGSSDNRMAMQNVLGVALLNAQAYSMMELVRESLDFSLLLCEAFAAAEENLRASDRAAYYVSVGFYDVKALLFQYHKRYASA